jgi:hypothetical protein
LHPIRPAKIHVSRRPPDLVVQETAMSSVRVVILTCACILFAAGCGGPAAADHSPAKAGSAAPATTTTPPVPAADRWALSTPAAVYQDSTDLLYGVFAGITGSGFDPTSLHAKLWQPPHTQDNGTARVTVSWEDVDAVESTSCYWLSPTTFGEVFLIQDPHAPKIVYDQTAATIGPLMLKIRAAVEQHA